MSKNVINTSETSKQLSDSVIVDLNGYFLYQLVGKTLKLNSSVLS
jgi:hypothetical protein